MATNTTNAAATAGGDAAASQQHLQGIDIAQVLRSEGPIVTCVLLRATPPPPTPTTTGKDGQDSKPSADTTTITAETDTDALVEEIRIDTTPKKNSVEKLLGGPFTFVGQYEEEGIMLMARRGWIYGEDDDDDADYDNDDEAKHSDQEPRGVLNPHKLQPPFDRTRVYGDILVLKVAEVDDPLDDDNTTNNDNNNNNNEADKNAVKAVPVKNTSQDEFFLDYTKKSYLAFAARTDVVPPEAPPVNDDDQEDVFAGADQNDDEKEEAGEWSGADNDDEDDDDSDEDEEAAQEAMMQLILSSVLKGFQAQNGRDPTEEELAVLKLTVAQKLGIPLAGVDGEEEEEEDDEDNDKNDENESEAGEASEKDVASPASSESSAKENTDKKRNGDDTLEDSSKEMKKPHAKKIKFDADASEDKKAPVLTAQ